ncbi:S-layer homology domain-containing protein [Paenibacillus xylanexedens]|uniref:S-layer homology domain-containing protein n=1 Tax=Paenibacillus xylanexedens TaxID=528191 RepID=UPI0011A7D771|nr:S-layer homology domain-containing protein [Paenibacillus xylanexedens]
MKKYLLTCMVLIIVSVACVSPVFAGFSDVDNNRKYDWARLSIDEMNSRGILTGYPDGSFRPEQSVTKAEFTVMVYRLFPMLRNLESARISGVPESHWASKEFAELYSTISPIFAADVQNYADDSYSYKPEKKMSRWDVLMTLDALFGDMNGPRINDLTTSDSVKQLAKVKDVPKLQFASYKDFEKNGYPESLMTAKMALIQEGTKLDWAGDFDYVKAQALYRFMKLGIITPDTNGFFYPDRSVTRAETVTILNRMLAAAGEDYAYHKVEESLSGSHLFPGVSAGFGANIFYTEPEETIILSKSPAFSLNPGKFLAKVAIRIESDQVVDVFVEINGQNIKYTFEQLMDTTNRVIIDVTGVTNFHVHGEARYPERLNEDGNNKVMIYVEDPEMGNL